VGYVTAIAARVLGSMSHYPYHFDTLGHHGLVYLAAARSSPEPYSHLVTGRGWV
jgi:hypothetical protein